RGRPALDLDGDFLLCRRPETEARAIWSQERRAEWQIAREALHALSFRNVLRVSTTLRGPTGTSSPPRSRSGASGSPLSTSRRAGRPGAGRRKLCFSAEALK